MKPSEEFKYIFLAVTTFIGIMLIYRILAASLITRAAIISWKLY